MNLPFTCGMMASLTGLAKIWTKIGDIQLAIMMLLFIPLWVINILIINMILTFMLSISTWLFSASESEPPKRLVVLLAIIPTLLELYWATIKLGTGTGYWGAFSW